MNAAGTALLALAPLLPLITASAVAPAAAVDAAGCSWAVGPPCLGPAGRSSANLSAKATRKRELGCGCVDKKRAGHQ